MTLTKILAGTAAALALGATMSAITPTESAPASTRHHHAAPRHMRPCATEDSRGPCYWNAHTRGNGHGRSFWVDAKQHVHYV